MKTFVSVPTVVDFVPVETKDGKTLFQLLIEQEALIPKADGSLRAGTLKARLLTDWSEEKCASLKGAQLSGYNIVRVECEAYTSSVSGEEKEYTHTWILKATA